MHRVLNIDKKIITQFVCKSRDKSFKPSYSMIGQCLLNKNENVIVSKSKNFLDLNKTSSKDSSRKLQTNCVINYFLSIFNAPYICLKIRCNGESCKLLEFWMHLNKALIVENFTKWLW